VADLPREHRCSAKRWRQRVLAGMSRNGETVGFVDVKV